jgi:threonine/homoserine/homoserine lactone efflux protein
MSFEHWLAFAAASAILLAIPGPTVLLVVSHALSHGRRAAMATVTGVALGDLTSMTASMLGLGVLLQTTAALFLVLKTIGALYLIYLGIKLWRAPTGLSTIDVDAAETHPWRIFAHAYAVTALNPKSIIFFVAFVPQFIDPQRSLPMQMSLFIATFVGLAILNAGAYGLLAAAARRTVRRPAVQKWVNRSGGSLLVAAGLVTLTWRRLPA